MADFLLIHGAWHGGWCWDRVVPLLETAGHTAHAPTLSGLEPDRTERVDSIGIETHVEDVVDAACGLPSNRLVLVGHSYGGFPMTGAADHLGGRVARYIYLDAGVPKAMSPGASFAWCDSTPPEEREKRLEAIVDLGLGPVLPAPPPEVFGIESAADRELLATKTRPMPAGTFTDRFTFTNMGTNGLPRTFIRNVDPAYPPLGGTAERVKADPSWGFHELRSGHDSMLTAPEALTELLLQISEEA